MQPAPRALAAWASTASNTIGKDTMAGTFLAMRVSRLEACTSGRPLSLVCSSLTPFSFARSLANFVTPAKTGRKVKG